MGFSSAPILDPWGPEILIWKKFVLMSEPALKCKNNAIFKQKYTIKLFISFKMASSCCFSLGGNLDFLQLKFKTSSIGLWDLGGWKTSCMACLKNIHYRDWLTNLQNPVKQWGFPTSTWSWILLYPVLLLRIYFLSGDRKSLNVINVWFSWTLGRLPVIVNL